MMTDKCRECITAGGRDTGGVLLENTVGIIMFMSSGKLDLQLRHRKYLLIVFGARASQKYLRIHMWKMSATEEYWLIWKKKTIIIKRKGSFYVLHFRIYKLNLS